MKCDVCGREITDDNLGFVKNPKNGDRVVKCKDCHEVQRPKKESSYALL